MSDYTHIASFDDQAAAEKLARRLTQEGFDAHVRNEAGEQFWKLFNLHPRAHCHVLVSTDRADEALSSLNELHATDDVLRGAIICPSCGSTRVEFPQFSRRTIIGALPAMAAAAGIIEQDFYCAGCHYTWQPVENPEDTVPAGKDMLH